MPDCPKSTPQPAPEPPEPPEASVIFRPSFLAYLPNHEIRESVKRSGALLVELSREGYLALGPVDETPEARQRRAVAAAREEIALGIEALRDELDSLTQETGVDLVRWAGKTFNAADVLERFLEDVQEPPAEAL